MWSCCVFYGDALHCCEGLAGHWAGYDAAECDCDFGGGVFSGPEEEFGVCVLWKQCAVWGDCWVYEWWVVCVGVVAVGVLECGDCVGWSCDVFCVGYSWTGNAEEA